MKKNVFLAIALALFLGVAAMPLTRAQQGTSDKMQIEPGLTIEPSFDKSFYYPGDSGYLNITFTAERDFIVALVRLSVSYYPQANTRYFESSRYFSGNLTTIDFDVVQRYELSAGVQMNIIVHFQLPSDIVPGYTHVRFRVDYQNAPVMPPIVVKMFLSETRLIYVESTYKKTSEILQTSLLQLTANYTGLEQRYNKLESDFNSFKNLTYGLVAAVVVLAACTVYVVMKSRKIQPKQ